MLTTITLTQGELYMVCKAMNNYLERQTNYEALIAATVGRYLSGFMVEMTKEQAMQDVEESADRSMRQVDDLLGGEHDYSC